MATTIITLKHSQGFTLTEIMIALLLSLVLMAGVLTIMSSSKRTYALQTKLAELQDNARFVMNDLKSDLRMAGYGGSTGGYVPFFDNGNLDNQTIKNGGKFPASDKMILNFFSGGPPPPGVLVVPPFLIPRYYEVCYIEGEFALFRGTTSTLCNNNSNLFVEGVENMQVRYGIDTSGDNIANRYNAIPEGAFPPPLRINPPPCEGSANAIVSVRITLLMRTVGKRSDLDGATDKLFQLDPGMDYNPNKNSLESGYRHRLFTSTIQIRNCLSDIE